jgi:hypothetical protein
MDEQLKQLMDYTKFHIGLYSTISTLLIAFVSTDTAGRVSPVFMCWLLATLALLLVAGMAGGLIGSSVPDHSTYDEFMKQRLGPWSRQWIVARECIHLEHTAFWMAALSAACGLIVSTYKPAEWSTLVGPIAMAVFGVIAVLKAVVRS